MFLTMTMYFQAENTTGQTLFTFFPLVVFFFILYFLVLRPQMKQQKEHRTMIDGLKKGDRVITSGGIWGEIDTVEAHTVRLKVNEKNKIKVTRSAISGLQPAEGQEPPQVRTGQ